MSKPELIIQDFGGINNADLKGTRARLIKGGSWKKQNIIVIIPAADLIPAKICLALWNLAFPPNNGVVRILAQGMEVGDAYSTAIEQVLADPNLSKFQFVLFCEHDNSPPSDGVIKLIEDMEAHPELHAIGGSYFTKGFGTGVWQCWGDPKLGYTNFMPQLPDPNGGLVECCGVAQGFTMMRLDMFKDTRLRRPWFKTQTKDGVSTQDLYLWSDARKYGYRCAIDAGIRVGHYDFEGKFGPPDIMY